MRLKRYAILPVKTRLNAKKLLSFKRTTNTVNTVKLNMIQASGLFKPQNEPGETIFFLIRIGKTFFFILNFNFYFRFGLLKYANIPDNFLFHSMF